MTFFTNGSYISTGIILVGNSSYDVTTAPSSQVKITPSNGTSNDRFGSAVAAGSRVIVIGAYNKNSGTGAAYLYDLSGTEIAAITAPDAATGDLFGRSVDVADGYVVIGAPYRPSSPGSGNQAGAVYVFDTVGNYIRTLTMSTPYSFSYFGKSVAIGQGRIVVGAPGQNSNRGAMYIYDYSGNQLTRVESSDLSTGDEFGTDVDIGSGRIVASSPKDDDNGTDSGSAYIFDLNGVQLAKVTPSDGSSYKYFGEGVSVGSGLIAIVGDDNKAFYTFNLNGTQISKTANSNGDTEDVVIGEGRICTGRYGGTDTGTLYTYDLNSNLIATTNATTGNTFLGQHGTQILDVGSGRIVIGNQLANNGSGVATGAAYILTTPKQTHLLDVLKK